MKIFFKILFAPFIWLIQSCSPLGSPVDEKISKSHFYNNSKTDIVYSPNGNWFELEASKLEADISSFKALSNKFGKDKNSVYYLGGKVNDPIIDKESFYVKTGDWMWHIGFDKNNAYIFDRNVENGKYRAKATIIQGANPITFVQFDQYFARDDKSYFFDNKMIDVHYATFKQINNFFHLDKNQAYYHTYQLFNNFEVDVNSFNKIDENYAYDDKNIYYFAEYVKDRAEKKLQIIPYSNFKNVEIFNKTYLRENDKVFYQGFQVKDVDIDSFEVLNEEYAKDKKYVYFTGILIEGADSATFHYSEKSYQYKDKNHIFRQGEILKK